MKNISVFIICLLLTSCGSRSIPDGEYARTNFDSVEAIIHVNDMNYTHYVKYYEEKHEIKGYMLFAGVTPYEGRDYLEFTFHNRDGDNIDTMLYDAENCLIFAKEAKNITFTKKDCS